MAFAHLLVGAVTLFGLYWTIKFINLPPIESEMMTRPTTTTASATTTTTTTTTTTSTTTSTTTTKRRTPKCRKGFHYNRQNGKCRTFTSNKNKSGWGYLRFLCKTCHAEMSTAFARGDKEAKYFLNLFQRYAAKKNITKQLAIGFYIDERNRSEGYLSADMRDWTTFNVSDVEVGQMTDKIHYPISVISRKEKYYDTHRYVFMDYNGKLFRQTLAYAGYGYCEYFVGWL